MRVRRFVSVLVAATVALTGAACTTTEPGTPSTGTGTVTNAPASGTTPVYGAALTAEQFRASLAIPGVTVLDVRTPAEFAGGHLEGAQPADINGDFEQAVAALDRSAPYAVYCRSGNRSATAVAVMKDLGFTNAWHLDGGIGAWQAAGYAVVKG